MDVGTYSAMSLLDVLQDYLARFSHIDVGISIK